MAQRHPFYDSQGQRMHSRASRGNRQGRFVPANQPRMPHPQHPQYPGHSNSSFVSQMGDQTQAANEWAERVRMGSGTRKRTLPNDVIEDYVEQLQSSWLDDRIGDKKLKSELIYEKLSSFLKESPDPWETALCLITSVKDYSQAKPSTLSFTILIEFQKWVGSSDNHFAGKEEAILNEDLRTRVFYATTGKHIPYFSAAVKAFKLDHPENEYFVPIAKSLLVRNRLAECAQIVARLGLQSHFSQEEILIPLLLTDKVNVIETYVIGNPEQQGLILSLLDHLCARETDLLSFAQNTGVKNIKGNKLSKKVLSKFAMKLMKLYDIPQEACPNIAENRAMSTIRYLLYKRYIEKSIGYGGWDDMVENAVGKNSNLKQQLIMELLSYNDMTEAVKWSERYNLPDSVLHPSVVEARVKQREMQDSATGSPSVEGDKEIETEENWDDEIEQSQRPSSVYYTLPLSNDQVTVVDTKEKLQTCLQRITKPSSTIGIDAEWKPCMGAAVEKVAVLQLAVDDHVFLVDFVTLRSELKEEDWVAMTESIFCDNEVLKIGYGLNTDLRILTKTFPCMKEPLQRMVRVVDIEKLANKMADSLKTEEGEKPGQPAGNSEAGPSKRKQASGSLPKGEEKGLSLLVLKTLGKPLSKGEQMSNWERRPLRQTQILYAALDAYVLLEVYKALVVKGRAVGLSDTDLEPLVVLKTTTRMERKKNKMVHANKSRAARMQALPHSPYSEEKSEYDTQENPPPTMTHRSKLLPSQLRVVCDTMLQGLGSQLRTCGVDTIIMSGSQSHGEAIKISRREERLVLSSGKAFDQIRANVGDGMCFYVPHDKIAKDQCMMVLQYFNVQVTKKDIFSRCSACNSVDFAKVPSKDMEKLYMFYLQMKPHSMTLGADGGSRSMSLYDVDQGMRSKFLEYGIDPATITFLHNRVAIQIETIPNTSLFSEVKEFYLCCTCGKVFWEGSHFERIVTQFEHILNMNTTTTNSPGDSPSFLLGDCDEDDDDDEDY